MYYTLVVSLSEHMPFHYQAHTANVENSAAPKSNMVLLALRSLLLLPFLEDEVAAARDGLEVEGLSDATCQVVDDGT